jgi:uncharacterized OsmC-like protein
MVKITGLYEGKLRCVMKHGPSGSVLSTDAPKDNEGMGAAFSPTDLVATALATCMMTVMGIVARRDGIALDGMEVEIEKHMAADPRRVRALPARLTIPGKLTRAQKDKLEGAARTCPVARSIHPDIEQPLTFVYPDSP